MPYGMSNKQYAAEIKRKQAAGIPLSNPTAAQQFQKANPQYFGPSTNTQTTAAPAQKHSYFTDYLGNVYKNNRPVDLSSPHTIPALQADPDAAKALQTRQDIISLTSGQRRLESQEQIGDLLKRLTRQANREFRYDPGDDPVYQAIVPQVQQDVMEQTNARGILNSSITGENMAKLTAGIIPDLANQAYQRHQGQFSNLGTVLNALMGVEGQQYDRARQANQDLMALQAAQVEQQQQQLENAWNRVKQLGYVDNTASAILGIPVGTPSFEAQQAYDDRAARLQIAREQIAGAMARTQASNAASMERQLQRQQWEESQIKEEINPMEALKNYGEAVTSLRTRVEKDKDFTINDAMTYANAIADQLDEKRYAQLIEDINDMFSLSL